MFYQPAAAAARQDMPQLEELVLALSQDGATACLSSLATVARNLFQRPLDERTRTLRLTNGTVQRNLLEYPAATAILQAPETTHVARAHTPTHLHTPAHALGPARAPTAWTTPARHENPRAPKASPQSKPN